MLLTVLELDYFSPLPPVRSGISDYSVDLLAELVELADVRVVRVGEQPVAPEVAARFGVVEEAASATRDSGARIPLYQIGNNPHHAEIYELALETPGIVVLHDVFLHHLLVERTLGHASIDDYLVQARHEAGWQGLTCGLPPRWSAYAQSHLFSIPAHRRLLERQLGVVVHSEWARRRIREEGIETDIEVVPMPMPVPRVDEDLEEAARRYRSSLGIDDTTLLVGSFGFQTPIKRTREVIGAVAHPGPPGLDTVHVLVAGEISPGLELEQQIESLGVAERVHLVGFLPPEDFLAALLACDLGVNLRYPSAGETSASLLRILAVGRSAIVSEFAQFAELPRDIVLEVPVSPPLPQRHPDAPREAEVGSGASEEVRALGKLLADFSSSRERALDLGSRARDFVLEHHDPRRCARELVEACQRLAAGTRGVGASISSPARPSKPSSLTWGRHDAVIEVVGVDDWRPGELRRVVITLRNVGFERWLRGDVGAGGVAVNVQLYDADLGRDVRATRPWLGLQHDVEPGEHTTFELALRRPLGAAELAVSPHVLGGGSFARGGPLWRRDV